jgi:hypothetical protein
VAVVALFVVSIRPFYLKNTGFTNLIGFGDQFDARALPELRGLPRYTEPDSWGYDGQFYAQLALDPLLRNPAMDQALDNPPYRARRMLFAWTAFVAGFGRPAAVIRAYAAQNIVAWFLLAWLLLRWLPPDRARNVVPWIGCLFGAGLIGSVRSALLEGPSMVVLTLAIVAAESERSWLGAALMGLAGLGRETNLIASGVLVNRVPQNRRELLKLVGRALLVALPLVAWLLYLWYRYPVSELMGNDNFSVPFAAYGAKWTSVAAGLRDHGWWSPDRFSLLVLVSLTTQAAFLIAHREWRNPWWRMGVMYCVLLPTLGMAVWAGEAGAAVRVLIPMTFAFNVIVSRSRWFWPLVIFGNLSVLYGLQRIQVPWLAQYL